MSDNIASTMAALDQLRVDAARLLPELQRRVLETVAGPEHSTWHRLLAVTSDFHRVLGEVVRR
jgi:hypothetical protein